MTELYLKYRPTKFSQLVGQREAVRVLNDMGKRKAIPHAILFTGPSGTGKTTIARILAAKLGCEGIDLSEVNAANFRGIDDIRSIQQRMGAAALAGRCRIWVMDECHQLTSNAQDSFLKLLEDTPEHVYFFLCTTDPQKLKKTIITRCTEIKCSLILDSDLAALVGRIVQEEEKAISEKVTTKIVEVAEGSARMALVLLHSVIGLPDEQAQLEVLEKADVRRQAIEIARALMNENTSWKSMAAILKAVTEDPETIRHMVLGYARKVLLSRGDTRSALVIDCFRDHFYDSKLAGLTLACYDVIRGK